MFHSDWHIHSEHSCDEACLPMRKLPEQAPAIGILDFGITDHLHTPFNLPDVVASHAAYLKCRRPGFHFGIEVSVVSVWELEQVSSGKMTPKTYGIREGGDPATGLAIGITAEQIEELGIEYVVGGTHWPMYVEKEREPLIRDYHRQNMFLAADPRVDIIAHPWWWMGKWRNPNGSYTTEPWLEDFNVIPRSIHDEFAATVLESDTCVEANIGAMINNSEYTERFRNQYAEYLRGLFERGVRITIGSDCHDPDYSHFNDPAAKILAAAGFREGDFSFPKFRL